jgi:YD repeat-containing protein
MTTHLKNLILILLALSTINSFAQKKKEIKAMGIKTITTTEIRGDKTINDNIATYNKNGQIQEEINYDKEGNLKTTTKYKYNASGDVTEEFEYDNKNVLKEKRQISYNKKIKTEELITDKNDKIIKKYVYSYNNNGLKKERQTYDSVNTLISTKKYTYGYKIKKAE